MARAKSSSVVAAAALLLVAVVPPSQASDTGAGQVSVIQAVPGTSVDVEIDGKTVAEGAEVGSVLGPFEMTPGPHEVSFSDGAGMDLSSSVDVATGAGTDLVLHLPAEVGGDAVVHTYAEPTGAIGPDKARVVLAHTATVAPADVRVNGQTVFTNIANGEFAEAELPAGTHEVALLPTGQTADPILGPVDVPLDASTLSMIYAYGNPSDGSMNVIAHTISLSGDGTVVPNTIETGSAGLVADVDVTPFSSTASGSSPSAPLVVLGLAGLLAAGFVGRHRRRASADRSHT